MRQIPSTVVVAGLLLIGAAWPSVQQWSDTQVLHHYLVHSLYLVSGALLGLQTAWWLDQSTPVGQLEEDAGVSS